MKQFAVDLVHIILIIGLFLIGVGMILTQTDDK